MQITFTYILSQILTVMMYVFLAWSYRIKNKHKIVLVDNAARISILLAYFILGAWTGIAMTIISLLRNLYILWEEKKHGKRKTQERRDYIFLAVVFLSIILVTIPTYQGFLSLFSVFATSLFSFSIWQKSTKVYKFCGIPVGILWIVYNIYIRSIFGIILELVLLVFSISGYISELKSPKNDKIKPENKENQQ